MIAPDPSNLAERKGPRPCYPSPAHREMTRWVRRVRTHRSAGPGHGESGSGKEGVARAIHRWSRRSGGPFVSVNCAALAESLLEAELFGATRGAYTGSDRDRPGLFLQADRGTLMLDEVGDMPAAMQAKLLRAVEQGAVRAVGGDDENAVDVRIVAATHRDLAREVEGGRFRDDLYHRLAVLRVDVPPLRARLDDLPRLVQDLTPRLMQETGSGPPRLSAEAWLRLRSHPWPGNVRELHAVLARALLRAEGEEISPPDLEVEEPATGPAPAAAPSLEQTMIRAALDHAQGNLTAAAAQIGWTRQKLYRRMKALGLPRHSPPPQP